MSIILFYKKEGIIKYTSDTDVLDNMYYLIARLPTVENLVKSKSMALDMKTKKIFESYCQKYKNNYDNIVKKIKKLVSQINYKIPLYDEHTKNLYIVPRTDVYEKVVEQYYRFPDEYLINYFEEQKKVLMPKADNDKILYGFTENNIKITDYLSSDIKYNIHYTQMSKERKYYKLLLMTDFLSQFDNSILQKTYIYTVYYYSKKVGQDITMCVRPSFLPHLNHIKPYYTKDELIKMSLNMNIINVKDIEQDNPKFIESLCKTIQNSDLSAKTLKEHQIYILKQDMLGMMQYYTLQGSFFMNQYLRGNNILNYKNDLLEKAIISIWKLINNSPAFDKDYISYRFIRTDEHLQFLQVGDTYVSNSFESTTRDPFYPNISHFGFILVKILIPANMVGSALCIESVSNFPEEQEIIFSPLSMFKLENKDNNVLYYHTDSNSQLKIETKYEFKYTGKKDIKMVDKNIMPSSYSQIVDFYKINKRPYKTVSERIAYFMQDFTSPINQFQVVINNKMYNLIMESYDSTNIYKHFYSVSTNNGLLIYTLIENYIGFTIEIGDSGGTYMNVNYYYRFNSVPNKGKIDDHAFILFLISVAYYFDIPTIKLYCEHNSCENLLKDKGNEIYNRGNYCVDFYLYLKLNIKKYQTYDDILPYLTPKFSYSELDNLKTTSLDNILSRTDRDELYQIYDMTYKHFFGKEKHNVADFYIWLIENYCMYVELFITKLTNITCLFLNDYYILDANMYLYNKNIIDATDTTHSMPPKNNYRINYDVST